MKPSLKLLAVAAALSTLIGCSERMPDASSKRLAEFFADDSDRTEAVLAGHATRIFKAQRDIPDDVLVRVYSYGNTVQRIYEGPAIRSRDAFNRLVSSKLLRDEKEIETHTEKPLALAAENAKGKEMYAVYISFDGGQEDTTDPVLKSIQSSVDSLGSNPAVRQVVLVGIIPKHQLRWVGLTKKLGPVGYIRGSDDAFSIPHFWEVKRK